MGMYHFGLERWTWPAECVQVFRFGFPFGLLYTWLILNFYCRVVLCLHHPEEMMQYFNNSKGVRVVSSIAIGIEERTESWDCTWGPILRFGRFYCLPLAFLLCVYMNKTALRNITLFINMQYLINTGFISACSFIPYYIWWLVHLGLERWDWPAKCAQWIIYGFPFRLLYTWLFLYIVRRRGNKAQNNPAVKI